MINFNFRGEKKNEYEKWKGNEEKTPFIRKKNKKNFKKIQNKIHWLGQIQY